MKVFKKPLIAVLLAVLIVLASTCLCARNGLIREHGQIVEDLGKSVLAFATQKDLPELASAARAILSDPDAAEKQDCDALIVSYNAASAGADARDVKDVEYAVKDYRRFNQMTNSFPASLFVELFHLF